ncbi:uridine kinase [Micromonospora sp. NPDC048063]|uniref:uridine kinase family protein n=1 Tax=Micromonospora sp. NPDC048063 TaxID=3364256 RepID=UPI00371FF08C
MPYLVEGVVAAEVTAGNHARQLVGPVLGLEMAQIAALIGQGGRSERPTLVGVEGFGGAGKTVFARRLGQLLGSFHLVHLDDFLIHGVVSNEDKTDFDRGELARRVLEPARRGELTEYQTLTDSDGGPGRWVRVPAVRYLIVEGVSAYHPELRQYYHHRIWVDAPMEIARERARQRDIRRGIYDRDLWDAWERSEISYKAKYVPHLTCDIVYDNAGKAADIRCGDE